MAPDNLIYEKIELYLSGAMSDKESADFEAEMASNTELMETVALYRSLQNSYSEIEQSKLGVKDLRETLQKNSEVYFNTKKEAKVFNIKKTVRVIAIAASLLFAFLLIQPLLFNNGNKNLFQKYYEQENLSVERGETDSIIKAVIFFNKKQYSQALAYFEPITIRNSQANNLLLALGECYMQLNQFDKAIKTFEIVIKKETVYKERAIWLKAMTLLKQDKKPECRYLLSTINENETYYKKAQQLIRELGK